jgi:hypothetical protein
VQFNLSPAAGYLSFIAVAGTVWLMAAKVTTVMHGVFIDFADEFLRSFDL